MVTKFNRSFAIIRSIKVNTGSKINITVFFSCKKCYDQKQMPTFSSRNVQRYPRYQDIKFLQLCFERENVCVVKIVGHTEVVDVIKIV